MVCSKLRLPSRWGQLSSPQNSRPVFRRRGRSPRICWVQVTNTLCKTNWRFQGFTSRHGVLRPSCRASLKRRTDSRESETRTKYVCWEIILWSCQGMLYILSTWLDPFLREWLLGSVILPLRIRCKHDARQTWDPHADYLEGCRASVFSQHVCLHHLELGTRDAQDTDRLVMRTIFVWFWIHDWIRGGKDRPLLEPRNQDLDDFDPLNLIRYFERTTNANDFKLTDDWNHYFREPQEFSFHTQTKYFA